MGLLREDLPSGSALALVHFLGSEEVMQRLYSAAAGRLRALSLFCAGPPLAHLGVLTRLRVLALSRLPDAAGLNQMALTQLE